MMIHITLIISTSCCFFFFFLSCGGDVKTLTHEFLCISQTGGHMTESDLI